MKIIKILFLFLITLLFIFYSCKTTNIIKEYEINKQEIIKNYYAPDNLDEKVYKYQDVNINGRISNFYISYNYETIEGNTILNIIDYDDSLRKIGLKKLLIFDNSVKVLDYIIYYYDEFNNIYENKAKIIKDTDYSLSLVFNNYKTKSETINKYYILTNIISCKKDKYIYKDNNIDVFIVTYKEKHKMNNNESTTVYTVYYAYKLCEVFIVYMDQYKNKYLKRELINIIDYKDFLNSK